MKRAYSVFKLKAFDEASREISGLATTPTPDRMGDIVEPRGAEFDLPIPLLWQHDSNQPIGHITRAKVGDDGIEVSGKVERIDEPGRLKDRLDEAWQSLKIGLVRGLSIGFRPLESARIGDTYAERYLSWEWLELSAVTIPANAEASIQTVKNYDDELRAALGQRTGVVKLDDSLIRRVSRKQGVVYLED